MTPGVAPVTGASEYFFCYCMKLNFFRDLIIIQIILYCSTVNNVVTDAGGGACRWRFRVFLLVLHENDFFSRFNNHTV